MTFLKLSKQSYDVNPILRDTGAGSGDDAIIWASHILGQSLLQGLSPKNIALSGLAVPGSPRKSDPKNKSIFSRVLSSDFHL